MQINMMTPSQLLSCPPGTLPGGLSRTRFFDGMFLTQADLENEQVYWRMKRRLTNRALGSGVVWGLRLTYDYKAQAYKLSPGYAIDCCGNDLVVECPVTITHAELLQRSAASLGQSLTTATGAASATTGNEVINYPKASVILQYVECPDAIRPVHRDACTPTGSSCEPSRIRESCRLLLVPICGDFTGCDPMNTFGKAIDNIRVQLGAQPQKAAPDTWGPSATYNSGKQTIGTWLAVAMHGYLATADKYNASAQARLVVAYLLHSVMSGLLDIDMASLGDNARGQLSMAVNQLSRDLCNGLLYPGPRCIDEHHGVYLGSMLLVPRTNEVSFFSQWPCRREVLTGPLINWWLCQFGLEPIDIIVNSIAEDQCEALMDQVDVLGTSQQLTDVVDNQVSAKKTVQPFDFAMTVARAITGAATGSGLVKVEATAPNGNTMGAVVPASAISGLEVSSAVASLAHANLSSDRSVQPLSRGPLRDLVTELASRARVSDIAGAEPSVVKALGTMTVSELLASEPEAILVKIGGAKPSDAQRAAVNQLYLGAESFVRDAATTAAGAAKAGITRAQLTNKDLKAALTKLNGVSATVFDAAAAAAAKR